MKNYEVEIRESKGTCSDELFAEMAKRGDITATKIAELMGMEVTIQGYAECNIKAKDKEFVIFYVDTDEYGLISAGSEIFMDSVKAYFGKVEKFRLSQIKTKKGNTYKAVPVLKRKIVTEKVENVEMETNDDLPF